MTDFLPVLRVLGALITFFALGMFLPWGISEMHDDGLRHVWAGSAVIACACGVALWAGLRRYRRELQPRHGIFLVSCTWLLLPLVATLPMMWSLDTIGRPVSFTHAYFESVSGLTTTGATVLSGLDDLPVSINFWRTFLQWLGGMGILVLAVAILPMLGVGGGQLFKAEVAGPIKESKFTPRIKETAKGLWGIYALLSLACFLGYWAGGMSAMDALMHMFATVSLGGLSSHDASLAYFSSPVIEMVAVLCMLAASCNFALYFVAMRKGDWRGFWRDPEMRATLTALIGGGLLVALFSVVQGQLRIRGCPALRCVPHHFGGQHDRIRDRRLPGLAGFRAAVHAAAVERGDQRGFDRMRHQDGARADSGQAVAARDDAAGASARGAAGAAGQPGGRAS